jgi:T-complex protein 1 subunit alpha
MMMPGMPGMQGGGAQGLDAVMGLGGEHTRGDDVRQANVTAAIAIANIVKSSLGPVGLDKMLLDDVGEITITNDGATILGLLEVEHPAGKILVELAGLQDSEVGDGTTSVVIIAAELLKRASELIKFKIHPTSIISGFRLAMREACKYVQDNLAVDSVALGRECLLNAAKTSMSSKLLAPEAEFFGNICVDAVLNVRSEDPFTGKVKYPIKSVNILKKQGKGVKDSALVNGFGLNCVRASEAMPKIVKNAKIALLDYNLNKYRAPMGVEVVVKDPAELEKIRIREAEITKERISLVINAGANVILTTKGIDDYSMKFLVEAGVMGVRRCLKADLKRIAKASGGRLVESLATLEGGEAYDADCLGYADEIAQERVCDDEMIYIRGTKVRASNTIVLRGPSSYYLDEAHRTITDVLNAVKRVLESGAVVPGGGAVETAVAIYLENFATTLGSREQLAIAEFAEALLVIPKTLAANAAQDAIELSAKLRAIHHTSQVDPEKRNLQNRGLDLVKGKIRDNLTAGVVEPAMSKVKQLQFATEAAVTILRIDDSVKLAPEGQQGGGMPGMM